MYYLVEIIYGIGNLPPPQLVAAIAVQNCCLYCFEAVQPVVELQVLMLISG